MRTLQLCDTAPSGQQEPAGRLAALVSTLPLLDPQTGAFASRGFDAALVQSLQERAEATLAAVKRGMADISRLAAAVSPQDKGEAIDPETVEALGPLVSELVELGGVCLVLAARCRHTQ